MRARSGSDEFEILDAARVEAVQVVDDLLTSLAQKIVKEYADARKRAEKGKGKSK